MSRRVSSLLVFTALVAAGCSDVPTAVTPAADPPPAAPPPSYSLTPGSVTGPVFPAPGGTAFSGVGHQARGAGRTWTYSGFDLDLFSVLAWGRWGDIRAGLSGGDGSVLAFAAWLSDPGNGVAVWTGMTPVYLGAIGTHWLPLRFTLTVTGSDAAPRPLMLATDPAAADLGIPSSLGAVHLVTENGWSANLLFQGSHPSVNGGAWTPLLDLYDALQTHVFAPAGQAVTSFGGGFYWTAAQCEAGSYYVELSGCVPAPPGTFVPGPGAVEATPCPVGHYQPSAGSVACLPAPAGSYVDVVGAISATPCPVGHYQPGIGASSCIPAPAGTFVPAPGAVEATPCPPGTYQPEPGASSCIPAPPGSFVAGTGAVSADLCPPGTYQPASGSVECLSAPAGTYVDVEGAAAAAPCPVGTYQPAIGSTSCIPAPIGSYVPTVGAVEALICPPGTTTHEPGASVCVTVSAPALTVELVETVEALLETGVLGAGDVNALTSQLDAALRQYERGNTNAAERQLGAFMNRVRALVRSRRLTPQEGASLLAAAEAIIEAGRS